MTTARSPEPRIVVGVDGSEQSKQALRWAARLAEVFGARIDVIGAWQIPAATGWTVATNDWNPQEDTEKLLVAVVDEVFGTQRPRDLLAVAREGNAAHVLIEASRKATLVVVGSRGHGGFAGLLLGAVSAHVAEHAHCPVVVVHGENGVPEAVCK
jgi:nucleotide-binding universal stress UspA family protein